MRIGVYARVSTLNGQNPETQLLELREYASHRGWQIEGEYVDVGVSGSKCSRPSLNRLIAHAHQRRFDGILVWKLDRFGRSLRHLVTALAELEALGITFISLKDNWDLSTPSGRLIDRKSANPSRPCPARSRPLSRHVVDSSGEEILCEPRLCGEVGA